MSEYDNNNRGAFWKNDKRETDKHPHYTGSLNVEGKDYWVSAWKSDGSNPKAPLVSFSIKAKDAVQAKNTPAPDFNNDDDIPW